MSQPSKPLDMATPAAPLRLPTTIDPASSLRLFRNMGRGTSGGLSLLSLMLIVAALGVALGLVYSFRAPLARLIEDTSGALVALMITGLCMVLGAGLVIGSLIAEGRGANRHCRELLADDPRLRDRLDRARTDPDILARIAPASFRLSLAVRLFGMGLIVLGIILVPTIVILSTAGSSQFGFATPFQFVFGIVPILIMVGLILTTLLVSSAIFHRRRSGSREHVLLEAIALSVENRLAIGPVLIALAASYRRRHRYHLVLIAKLYEAGIPLNDILIRLPHLVSRETRFLIRIGQATGRLRTALQHAVDTRSTDLEMRRRISGQFFYVGIVATLIFLIASITSLAFLQEIQLIIRDFDLKPPPITRSLQTAFDFLGAQPFLLLAIILALFSGLSAMALWSMGLLHIPAWPIISRLARPFHSGRLLRSLSMAVEADQPLEPILVEAENRYPRVWVCRKIRRALARYRAGTSLWPSLFSVSLISRPEWALLEAAERTGNLAWALRDRAEAGERRIVGKITTALTFLVPLCIVALGAAVAVIAVALFLPLIEMILNIKTT